ncbi:uracil-DNA glycosylase [Paracoccus alkanivorans]|uniref:Type-4 uracil-DNA glycosylase n=1 Tax=Paracoccus alkanivorans TaxID=2116655 RepID=A0A3M0MEF0_9RHOB|nr:uracil-DNA glycosylase [Paracoccus alkanivorans]RMC36128.1 uracil-DNA glycosylase [Paracoccus alkanivorans]
MDGNLTYQGIGLDAATALALLEWQAEMGAEEPILDNTVDRFELAARPKPVMPEISLSQVKAPAALSATPDDPSALVAEAEALAASADSLAALASVQEDFDGIELKKGARNFCFSDGNPKARVLILGEAPGDQEDREGRPFVGRAGQLLNRMFGAIGLARDAVDAEKALYIVNVLTWRPPGNRDPSPDEIAVSLPFVRRHIELASPDLIVLMGNIPCQAALGRRGILRLRGQWTEAFGRPALPMTHPAYLLRNPAAKREAWADLLSIAARLETASA